MRSKDELIRDLRKIESDIKDYEKARGSDEDLDLADFHLYIIRFVRDIRKDLEDER